MTETLKSWIYRFAPLWYMVSSLLVGCILLALGKVLPPEVIHLVLEMAGGLDVVRQILAALLAAMFAGTMGLAVNQHVQIKAAQRDLGVEDDGYIGPITKAAWRSGGMSGWSRSAGKSVDPRPEIARLQAEIGATEDGDVGRATAGGAARMPRPEESYPSRVAPPETKAIAKKKPTPKGPFNGRARP
jgi:hypothetical protein